MEVHKENTVNPYNTLVVKTQWITINRLTQGGECDFKVISNTLEYTLSEKMENSDRRPFLFKRQRGFYVRIRKSRKSDGRPKGAQEMW